MKKIILGLLILCAVFVFASCATQECSFCRQEKKCEKIDYYGETLWICDSCEEDFEDLRDMLEDFEK